jgi:hypothetical protein
MGILDVLLYLAVFYAGCLVGANSPTTFKRSRKGLERIAESALAKARVLALRGKTL